MTTTVNFNGAVYTIPNAPGESGWGADLTLYLQALASSTLQKVGGTQTLTADIDFGASYGIKASKFSSRSTPATAGIVRLGNNESVGWRNAANSANLELKVNASNKLEFDGALISFIAAALTASRALVSDGSGLITVSSTTSTQLGYLASATGTTGTTSTNLVFSQSPVLVAPTLGAASATSINKVAITAPATGSTFTIADGKTLTANNTMTLAGADDTGALTLAAGAQVVGGNSNNNDIITRTATQTLTNKTLTTPTLTAPVIDQANFTQAASATTPAAGKSAVYVNSGDAKLHVVDSSGNDVAVGSGSSGRNYLGDWFDAAKDIGTVTNSLTDVVDTSDRTANKTTWGSSNTSLLTIARSASSPLRQSYSYAINEAGSSSGAFVESPLFTLDSLDLGKPVTVSFDVSGNSTSDYYQVYICRYDSNDVLKERIPIAGTASATSPYSARLPVGTTNFQGFFVAGSEATNQYALRIVSNNNSADSIKIDSLYVGPQSVVQGAAVTDWVSWTPTGSWSTNTTYTGKYRQEGDSAEFDVGITLAGAPTSAALTINLPTGLTIDTTKMADASTQNTSIGVATLYDASSAFSLAAVGYNTTTSVAIIAEKTDGTYLSTSNNVTQIVPWTWASGDKIFVRFKVPIVGWSSNVTMANRAVEEYSYNTQASVNTTDTTSFGYGPAGTLILSHTASTDLDVQFTTPYLSTDRLDVEISTDRVRWTSAEMNAGGSIGYVRQGGVSYGITVYPKSGAGNENKATVNFSSTARPTGATYASAGQAWSAFSAYYWRVRKVSGGAAVGYPIGGENIVVKHTNQNLSTTTYTSSSVESGTYRATITNGVNVASSTGTFDLAYIKIGKVIHVSGLFNIDPTSASTLTEFSITLPYSDSLFTYTGGAGVSYVVGAAPAVWQIYASASPVSFRGYPNSNANQSVTFNFTYAIA